MAFTAAQLFKLANHARVVDPTLTAEKIRGASSPEELIGYIEESLTSAASRGNAFAKLGLPDLDEAKKANWTNHRARDNWERQSLKYEYTQSAKVGGIRPGLNLNEVKRGPSGKVVPKVEISSSTFNVNEVLANLKGRASEPLPPTSSVDIGKYERFEQHIGKRVEALGGELNPYTFSLGPLSWDDRFAELSEAANILGLKDYIGRGRAPTFMKPPIDEATGAVSSRSFARFTYDRDFMIQNEDIGTTLLSQLNFQFRPELFSASRNNIADIFRVSGRLPTTAALKRLHAQKTNKLVDIGKYAVVDVETPGLKEEYGIRQFTARFYDEAGIEDPSKLINLHFRSSMMDIGHYGTNTFEDFIRSAADSGQLIEDSDFASSLKKAFQMLNSQDSIVGQNISFDMGMLQASYKKIQQSPIYKADAEFRKAVDTFFSKKTEGKIVDIAQHARMLLGDLRPSELLGPEGKAHSIENMLLGTSALQDILDTADPAERETVERLLKESRTRLHDSKVDTWLEGHVFNLIRKIYQDPDADLLKVGERLPSSEAAAEIARGGAVTAWTNINDPGMISARLARQINLENLGPEGLVKLGITPMQQAVFQHRDLSLQAKALSDPQQLMPNLNIFRDFGQETGFFGEEGINLFSPPSAASVEAVQQRLAQAGIPLAGLHPYERLLTSAAARSSYGATALDTTLADTLPKIAFKASRGAGVVRGRSRIPTMSLDLLEELGALKVEGKPIFTKPIRNVQGYIEYTFSTFQTPAGKKGIGLYVNPFTDLGPEEVGKRVSAIREELNRLSTIKNNPYGLTPQSIENLTDSLINTQYTAGIQVGSMISEDNPLWDMLHHLEASTADRRRPDWLMAGIEGVSRDNDILNVGAVMRNMENIPMSAEQRKAEREAVAAGLNNVKTLREQLAASPKLSDRLERFKRYTAGHRTDSMAYKIYETADKVVYDHLTPKKVGIAGAVATAALLAHHIRKNNKNDATLARQDYEGKNFYNDYRSDLGLQPVTIDTRQGNPLITAGLVQNMHSNAIGHTNMSNDRNSGLFSGVL